MIEKLLWKIRHFFTCPSRKAETKFQCPDCGRKYTCYYNGADCNCGVINLCKRCARKHIQLGH